MVIRHVWTVPVIAVGLLLAGMFSGYIIGAVTKHFPVLLPFISNGGSFPPEGCIFAQFLNMASFFGKLSRFLENLRIPGVLTCYIRHRQTVEYYGHRLHWEETTWRWVSLVFMYIGILGIVGLTVVANFPVNEMAMFFKVFLPKGAGKPPGGWRGIKWFTKESPFYLTYMIATSAEWAMVLALELFVLSFVAELRHAYAHAPRVIFKRSSSDGSSIGKQALLPLWHELKNHVKELILSACVPTYPVCILQSTDGNPIRIMDGVGRTG
ncbi:unnamed protein product [Haemonchus placei]|uniref:RSN1_7TM domain-containing protein n=1 Tax=Haemonchus placei TaxID=6290 RepID=A0A158QQ01_HAEPC|nr:unnamed protein product [Haemonchus placei]